MPDNMKQKTIILIGAGKMAVEYSKVLQELVIPFEVIGRGEESAENFYLKTGIAVKTGGIESWFWQNKTIPESAIVAVNVEELANTTTRLMKYGVKKILVEKPAGLNAEEIKNIVEIAKKTKAGVYVAYNRRFYASTIKAKQLLEEDGGISSFHFEFTERSHLIEQNQKIAPVVKENWFLANSSHVVDLAFFLGGKPKNINSYITGSLNWHPSAAIFAGAGITEAGALFSYHANWEAPGNWKVELYTRKKRLILDPLEELYMQTKKSVSIEKVEIDNALDKRFKPGLYNLVKAFLSNNSHQSLTKIDDLLKLLIEIFAKIIKRD